MNTKTLRAISYITSVAAEELTILQWVTMLNKVYSDGIPEQARMSDVINYFVTKFLDFEAKTEDDSQEGLDKLYNEFISYIFEN